MTDEVQEGALPTEELQAPEVLETSPAVAEVQQPSGGEAGITEARLIEILAERDEKQARKDQSAKDRAISAQGKDIVAIFERLEELGGDQGALLREADQQAALDENQTWQAGIDSRLAAMATANTRQTWQDEWDVDSQKILDAAETKGIVMSNEEVNQVAFNNGIAFETQADAEAALTAALVSRALGETSVSVVSTEGGEVAQIPEPTEPQSFRQQFDKLQKSGDADGARALLDSQWDVADAETAKGNARKAAEDAGLKLAE